MKITPSIAERLARDLLGSGNDDSSPTSPFAVGRYRISVPLGVGGMGTVYRARHDQTNHEVALKLIRPELISAESRRRFEHETRILGRLQHPGIARIFDAGEVSTDHGSMPYFAMEVVDGNSITEYVETHNLSTPQRLELFLAICEAVEHAHQKGVIHRDLKPANIIVDSSGRPRILDFGVARLTDSDVQVTTMQTDIGKLVGTIPYMSPEQAGGNPDDLDTRSDVYALGIILYRLLAGRLPYVVDNLPIPDAVRVVRETDPTPLSSVNRTFRGDLETIAAKALSKEKERRYQSVTAFASDLRRYLKNEPIDARPASAFYQISKFARRHSSLVMVSSVCIALLLLATVFSIHRASSEKEARKMASESAAYSTRQLARATQVTQVLTRIFDGLKPKVAAGRDVTVLREMIDSLATSLDEGRISDPLVEIEVRSIIGPLYIQLGESTRALDILTPAAEMIRTQDGTDPQLASHTLFAYAGVLRARGKLHEALEATKEVLELRRELVGTDHEYYATALERLGLINKELGNSKEYAEVAAEVLRIRRLRFQPKDPAIGVSLSNLASAQRAIGQPSEAEASFKEAIAIFEKSESIYDLDRLNAIANLTGLYESMGQFQNAEAQHLLIIAERKRLLGPDHPLLATALSNYGSCLISLNRLNDAEVALNEAVEIYERGGNATTGEAAYPYINLCTVFHSQGDLDRAESFARRAEKIRLDTVGPDHCTTALVRVAIAAIQCDRGEFVAAEHILNEAITSCTSTLNERAFARGWMHVQLARALSGQDKQAAAVVAAEKGLQVLEVAAGNRVSFQYAQAVLGNCLSRLDPRDGPTTDRAERLLRDSCSSLQHRATGSEICSAWRRREVFEYARQHFLRHDDHTSASFYAELREAVDRELANEQSK